jgi:signal transduction histidine kinase
LVIADVNEDYRTVYLSSIEDLSVYLGVPISRGHRIWGTLSILGKHQSQFGPDDVRLLTSVGEEIGIVVENVRLRRKAERLLVVQERNRLARELHDSVTQSLYSVTLFAEAGRRAAQADNNEEISDYFSHIGKTSQQALKEMRLLIHRLRPSVLAKEGLVRALQQRLNSVEGRTGINGRLLVEGETELYPALEDVLFQIAQEALNNALKHAMASDVTVRLNFTEEETVTLEIKDNGRGFDLEEAIKGDGMGLVSMRERAENFDGQLSIETEPGRGCQVRAILSYRKSTPMQWGGADVEELL